MEVQPEGKDPAIGCDDPVATLVDLNGDGGSVQISLGQIAEVRSVTKGEDPTVCSEHVVPPSVGG